MSTLLKTDLRRYFTHPLTLAALLFAAFLGTIDGVRIRQEYAFMIFMHTQPDIFLFLLLLCAQAAVLAVVISSQYQDGIFRLKAIAGHSKGTVFFSTLLSGLIVSLLLPAAYFLLFCLTAHRALNAIPLRNTIAGGTMILLIFQTAAALTILFCTQIQKRMGALVLCTAGMFVLFAANHLCNYELYPSDKMVITLELTDDPDPPAETVNTYRHAVRYLYLPASSGVHWNQAGILVGSDGEPVDTDGSPLQEQYQPVPRVNQNIKYIGGPWRTFLTVVDTLNPLRPLNTAAVQYRTIDPEKSAGNINVAYRTQEREMLYSLLPKYLPVQLSAFALYCFAGWLLFRRKELR